ncbi:tetratricopeptide repeat protein [Pelagibius sp.]|uniref:tetratricopeptide repeat protein n=1 Tax=Pelagibius sp. TaxID=1931238 RepID=UPI003B507363
MTQGSTGRPMLRMLAVLGLAGLVVGCASTDGGPAYAPAGFGKDDASRAERLVRYCDRLAEEGKYLTALGLCARAHEIDPQNPETMMRIAGLLQTLDRDDAAAQTYTALLAQHPGHQEALYSLGKVYMDSGEVGMASIQFNRAMVSNPEDPRPYNALGIIRDQAGEHQAAQELYRLALERNPRYLSARNNLGLSLALNGQRDEAIEVLAEAAVEPGVDETVLRNLEAAYASTAMAVPLPGSAPAGLPPAPGAPAEPPQAIVPSPKPVIVDALEGHGSEPAKGGGKPPAIPEQPIPLLVPSTAGETEQTSAGSPDTQGTAGPAEDDGPFSVIADAVARLLEPPAWADFEPGSLLAELPPAAPKPPAPPLPVAPAEPAVLEPTVLEEAVFEEAALEEAEPVLASASAGEDFSAVQPSPKSDPYYLSLLVLRSSQASG